MRPWTACSARSGRSSNACPSTLPPLCPFAAPTQNGKAEPTLSIAAAGTPSAARVSSADLSQLLSGVLLGFTVDFERKSRISLPISANTLRVLRPSGVRIRDLPRLTGVSKEANAMCAGWLERHGCAMAQTDPATARGKVLRLTEKGSRAQQKYRRLLPATEAAWGSTYGSATVNDLRAALEHVVGDGTLAHSPLAGGLDPYPDNSRPACGNVPTRCRTTRWCCIVVATPTAAEHPSD